jgi:hypothetical protein
MRLGRDVVSGAVAGAVGTAAMDYVWYRRYRRDGGKDSFWRWEFGSGAMTWDGASAPGQLGRKALRAVTRREPPDEWARPVTNIVHWGTGVGWSIQYGVLARRTSRHPWLRALILGPAVWSSGYVLLPLAKVYKPIWQYDARTLGKDLSAHMAYGAAASATFAALTRRR